METWAAQLLGPLGLLAGCLIALWAFATERIVAGSAHKRLRDQNEALLRRLDRAVTVTGRAVEVADPVEKK